MEVRFIVDDKPMGKQRPKFARRGKFTTTYTPQKTANYEKQVKIAYNKFNRGTMLHGPIQVDIKGVFPIPKSTSKKKYKEMIDQPHTKKPDCDNLAKIILDPLNKLAYDDDSQVCKLCVDKIYGETPRVEVKLSEIRKINREIIQPIFLLSRYPEPPIYQLYDYEKER